jgi:hypothetical protein
MQPLQIAVIVEAVIIIILLGVIIFLSIQGYIKKHKKGKEATSWESESSDPRVLNGIHLQHPFPRSTRARTFPNISVHENPKSQPGTGIYQSYTTCVAATADRSPGQQTIPKSLQPGPYPEFNLVVTDQVPPIGTPYMLPPSDINDWSQATSGFLNSGPTWSPDPNLPRGNIITSRHGPMLGLGIQGPENSQAVGPYHLLKSQTWPVLRDSAHQTHHMYPQSPSRTVSPISAISNIFTHTDHGDTPTK